jgi:hypothetical protein
MDKPNGRIAAMHPTSPSPPMAVRPVVAAALAVAVVRRIARRQATR